MGTYECTCGERFLIYHHRAFPEDPVEQAKWLEAQLEREHAVEPRIAHKDSYSFPS